jgi:FkbM family methyltransferase
MTTSLSLAALHMANLKQRIRDVMPMPIVRLCRALGRAMDPYAAFSYTQEGEDMILLRLFGSQRDGFYVKVGAHHPYRFSNTCVLAMRGWRGINIDADARAIEAFQRDRPDDVNLALGFSDKAGQFTLYVFFDPALNTIDPDLAREREELAEYRLLARQNTAVERLDSILRHHLPDGRSIDLLNVDVEGRDLEVLRSNDWQCFRPRCVVVEARVRDITNIATEPTHSLLKGHGYNDLFAKTVNTLIYVTHEDA